MSFDASAAGLAFAGPGMDTRLWISNGWVKEEADGAPSVRFTDDNGDPLPNGPTVAVILQPSMVEVACRVASGIAGVQEGEWFPFLQRDEVIVGIPSGNEMAGPVILGRLNNAIDEWPTEVAGMDTTKNNVAFRRLRTPYAIETASAYLVRSALTGAQFGLDTEGQVIFNDSEGSRFFMGADVVGFSLAGEKASIQLVANGNRIAMTAGETTNFVLTAGETTFLTQGTINIGTSGVNGAGHAVTIEQVIVLIGQIFDQLFSQNGGDAAPIALMNTHFKLAQYDAYTAPAITAATSGALTSTPLSFTALKLALLVAPDGSGVKVGCGRGGFLL
jgi:hypothetical protein